MRRGKGLKRVLEEVRLDAFHFTFCEPENFHLTLGSKAHREL